MTSRGGLRGYGSGAPIAAIDLDFGHPKLAETRCGLQSDWRARAWSCARRSRDQTTPDAGGAAVVRGPTGSFSLARPGAASISRALLGVVLLRCGLGRRLGFRRNRGGLDVRLDGGRR